MVVDAPDEIDIDLQYEFFGRNMSYHLSFGVGNDGDIVGDGKVGAPP